jgi:hypothetical protein
MSQAAAACEPVSVDVSEMAAFQGLLHQSVDVVFLARLTDIDQEAGRIPTRLRFEAVANIKGEAPPSMTVDGDFWGCSGGPGRIANWRNGDLALVYGERLSVLANLARGREAFEDQASWDGWRVIEAIPLTENADPRTGKSLREAARLLRNEP